MTILTMTYLLLQSSSYLSLWPYLLLVVVVLLLVAVLIQNRIVRLRVNESIASATSTYEMMEKHCPALFEKIVEINKTLGLTILLV